LSLGLEREVEEWIRRGDYGAFCPAECGVSLAVEVIDLGHEGGADQAVVVDESGAGETWRLHKVQGKGDG
jgi:hypothetical protein